MALRSISQVTWLSWAKPYNFVDGLRFRPLSGPQFPNFSKEVGPADTHDASSLRHARVYSVRVRVRAWAATSSPSFLAAAWARGRPWPHFTGRSQGPERVLTLPTSHSLSGVGGRAKWAWGAFSFLGTEAGLSGLPSRLFSQLRHRHKSVRTTRTWTHTCARPGFGAALSGGALDSAPGPPSIRKIPSETGKLDPHQGK